MCFTPFAIILPEGAVAIVLCSCYFVLAVVLYCEILQHVVEMLGTVCLVFHAICNNFARGRVIVLCSCYLVLAVVLYCEILRHVVEGTDCLLFLLFCFGSLCCIVKFLRHVVEMLGTVCLVFHAICNNFARGRGCNCTLFLLFCFATRAVL